MRNLRVKKSGFTLVEVLIATGIFTTVSMLAMTAYINITRIQSRINLENAIYEDGRFMLERLSRDVRENAVDYEEYFNKNFKAASGLAWPYGHTYGCYSLQFYNPGIYTDRTVDNHYGLGALCGIPADGLPADHPGCTIFKPSLDINTGKNPFAGRAGGPAEDEESAFCASPLTQVINAYDNAITTCSPGKEFYPQKELYLIDKTGKKKTIFARRKIGTSPDVYALGMIQLEGEDSDSDGVFDKWENCASGTNAFCCADGYDCTLNGADTLETTLATYTAPNQLYKGFVPVSPLRSTVTRLNFIVTPIEDPHKAFAEFGELAQPKVTIAITLQPSPDQLKNFGGDPANPPEITLQTTVSSRVQTEVKSYPQTFPTDCDY